MVFQWIYSYRLLSSKEEGNHIRKLKRFVLVIILTLTVRVFLNCSIHSRWLKMVVCRLTKRSKHTQGLSSHLDDSILIILQSLLIENKRCQLEHKTLSQHAHYLKWELSASLPALSSLLLFQNQSIWVCFRSFDLHILPQVYFEVSSLCGYSL